MYNVEKNCLLNDISWVAKVKQNYINIVSNTDYADSEFIKFIKNPSNLKINKKTSIVYCANWNIELTYKVTVSKSYEVFDGYDVKTEGTLTPRYNATGPDNLHLEEKTTYNPKFHKETQSHTDNVKRNITKYIVSSDGCYSDKNEEIDQSLYKTIQEKDLEKLLGTNYKSQMEADINFLKNKLENKDIYKEDKKAYRKYASNLVSKQGCTLSDLEITNVKVSKPKMSDINIYIAYKYELVVDYDGKEYFSSIIDDTFYAPELKISKEAQKKLDKTAFFVNIYNKIGNVFTYTISIILALFVIFGIFVKLYLYSPDWSQTFVKFPFLLVNIALIALLILFSIRLSYVSNVLISESKEGTSRAVKNQKYLKRKIQIRSLCFYLVAIICVLLIIFQIFCIIRLIPMISGVKISFL